MSAIRYVVLVVVASLVLLAASSALGGSENQSIPDQLPPAVAKAIQAQDRQDPAEAYAAFYEAIVSDLASLDFNGIDRRDPQRELLLVPRDTLNRDELVDFILANRSVVTITGAHVAFPGESRTQYTFMPVDSANPTKSIEGFIEFLEAAFEEDLQAEASDPDLDPGLEASRSAYARDVERYLADLRSGQWIVYGLRGQRLTSSTSVEGRKIAERLARSGVATLVVNTGATPPGLMPPIDPPLQATRQGTAEGTVGAPSNEPVDRDD